MIRCPRSSQSKETKAIIRTIKKNIDAGMDWKEAIKPHEMEDSIQREKVIKAIVDYI